MNRRWVAAIPLAFVAGCGGFPAAKVDEAQGHVRHALEVWKGGGKPADLTAEATPVEFNERMWNAGEKLVAFEMGGARYVSEAAVVRCEATLTVRNLKGKERTESVVYDVTPGPPVKVVFNPMP